MFSTNDLNAVSTSLLPILEVYNQALSSKGGATFMTVWFLFIYFGAGISCVATTGRLTWAFARDNGLPFSQTFAKVHPTLKVPIWATVASTIFQMLYGLIYIGSTTAFNSIISLTILGLNVTYMIPQAIVLFRGREKVLPKRYFNLGPYFGRFCNAFSLLWVSLYTVLFCFPPFLPVTKDSMNYVSVVIAGVVLFITVFWLGVKKGKFVGPVSRLSRFPR
jgi:choline transport protein